MKKFGWVKKFQNVKNLSDDQKTPKVFKNILSDSKNILNFRAVSKRS